MKNKIHNYWYLKFYSPADTNSIKGHPNTPEKEGKLTLCRRQKYQSINEGCLWALDFSRRNNQLKTFIDHIHHSLAHDKCHTRLAPCRWRIGNRAERLGAVRGPWPALAQADGRPNGSKMRIMQTRGRRGLGDAQMTERRIIAWWWQKRIRFLPASRNAHPLSFHMADTPPIADLM